MTDHEQKRVRKSVRISHDATLHIAWNAEGKHNSGEARFIDVSTGGVLIRTHEPVPVGSYVTLDSPNAGLAITGWVRHCSPDELWFAIGVEYTKNTRTELIGFPTNEDAN